MPVEYGQKIDAALATVDNAITLASSTDNVNGSSFDIGINTSPQSVAVRVQFGITNSVGVPTDGYDVDIRVQFSPDDANWPDAGRGQPLGNWADPAAGADLALSEFLEFVPKARYCRFQYDNNNGTDDVEATAKIAQVTMQGQ